MNSWNFTGNLGQDCEVRALPDGTPITSFSVATKAGYGDKATTTWARCSMFGRRGESVAPYLLKGQLVGVVGEMTAREWQDKEGLTRTSIEVRVNDLSLLGSRDSGTQGGDYAPQQQRPQAPQRPAQNQYAQQSGGGMADLDSDEIPF